MDIDILPVFILLLLFNYRSAQMKNDAAVALHSLFTNACTTMYGILKELWYKEQVTKNAINLLILSDGWWYSLQCVRASLTCYRVKGPVGCIKSNVAHCT